MTALWIINHWLHLMAAATVVGGVIFLRVATLPVLNALDKEQKESAEPIMVRKSKALIIHSLSVLVVTGILNLGRVFMTAPSPPSALYLMLFVVKIMLVVTLFVLSFILLSPSPGFKKYHEARPKWLVVCIALGVSILLISSWLRLIPPPV